jgi:hypothetical protein
LALHWNLLRNSHDARPEFGLSLSLSHAALGRQLQHLPAIARVLHKRGPDPEMSNSKFLL